MIISLYLSVDVSQNRNHPVVFSGIRYTCLLSTRHLEAKKHLSVMIPDLQLQLCSEENEMPSNNAEAHTNNPICIHIQGERHTPNCITCNNALTNRCFRRFNQKRHRLCVREWLGLCPLCFPFIQHCRHPRMF